MNQKFESKLCCLMQPVTGCEFCDTVVCRPCFDNLGRFEMVKATECCKNGTTDLRGLHWWSPSAVQHPVPWESS